MWFTVEIFPIDDTESMSYFYICNNLSDQCNSIPQDSEFYSKPFKLILLGLFALCWRK